MEIGRSVPYFQGMQILLDVSCLDHQQISGVGTYTRFLSQALRTHSNLDLTGSWRLSRRKKLQHIKFHWEGRLKPYVPVWSDWTLRHFDIFHGPDFKIPNVHGPKRVVTIHDMAVFEEGFSDSKFAKMGRDNITYVFKKQRPDAVIAVSHFTRREILKRFPEYENRVHTIWHGADHLTSPPTRLPRPIPEPYFLFVGNLESRKNVTGLLRAFANLRKKSDFQNTKLILIGKPGHAYQQIENVAKETAGVVFPGFVSNENLVQYYQNAEAFVYPSFYEGFGFPILEAMQMDTPVITSSVSATAEVAGEAALLVSPHSDVEIANAMERVSNDRDLRSRLIERGRSRIRDFTWKKCADETVALYNSIRQ
jgi:glycosyltransferase involved in cell wall biosynthesis